MKKLFLVLFILCACVASAQDLIGYQDSSATDLRVIPVSSLTPLPTSSVVTIGSVTVDAAAPPNANSTTPLSVTDTSKNITSLANRDSINVSNQSATATIWLSLDSVTASAAVGLSIPIPPYGFYGVRLNSGKIAAVVTSTTASGTCYQDGYL